MKENWAQEAMVVSWRTGVRAKVDGAPWLVVVDSPAENCGDHKISGSNREDFASRVIICVQQSL